ncbi:MAG: GMP synthase [Chitinophagales bacterium]|nr:GMP synthase [Chitinophagales bacterium]
MPQRKKIKLAILDMYDHHPNEGMRCLQNMVNMKEYHFDWEVFDVRGKSEMPSTNFDIYLSSGGPGSPFEGEGTEWEKKYFTLLEKLWTHNQNRNADKKYIFGVCYSFQMMSRFFEIGNVCKRKSTAFGVFPVHKTENAKSDKFFRNLPDPFYAVDSRDWQVIDPEYDKLMALNGVILSLEKKREHIPLQRAIMAMNIGKEFYITQFHPEADAEGMLRYFALPEKRNHIISNHGDLKLAEMIHDLSDNDKVPLTKKELIPAFLRSAVNLLQIN